jgi:outer membrane protein assembly factor BamB
MWIRSQPNQQILQASSGSLLGTFSSDTSPAFAGGTVIEMTGSRLTAASSTTLATQWTQRGDGQLATEPVIAGSVVYVGSRSGSVYGYSLATGKQVWQGQTGSPVVGTDAIATPESVLQNPTIGDGMLVVPSGNRLTVFGAASAAKPPPITVRPVPPIGTPPARVTYPDEVGFQENAAHDGYAGPALAGTLHQRWTHTFTDGEPGSPVIVGGRMFIPVTGPDALNVYAFSAATGARLWGPVAVSNTTGWLGQAQGGGGITYDAGRLFVLSGSGLMKALAPTTGAVLWTKSFQLTPPSPLASWPAAPVAYGGRVYAAGDSAVQIISEITGADVGGPGVVGDFPWTIPAVNARGVFIDMPNNDAKLLSTSGAVIWSNHTGTGGTGGSAAVLHGSQVWIRTGYLGGPGEVLDQATGKVLRSFDSDTPPAFAVNRGVLSHYGTLTGIDATTGATSWSEAGDAFLNSPPVIAGNTAYVTSALSKVYGYDVTTGVETWEADLPGAAGYTDSTYVDDAFDTALTIGDGYLAVPTFGGTLVVFGA